MIGMLALAFCVRRMIVDFKERIQKEMSEAIVKAILEDAGYRVIDFGIERVLRELSCLTADQYNALGFPDAARRLPDFTVLTREQDKKFLVEVKYRKAFDLGLLQCEEIQEQISIFGELYLVCINGTAPDPYGYGSPRRFVRGCRLSRRNGVPAIHARVRQGSCRWTAIGALKDDENLWWKMSPLSELFETVNDFRYGQQVDKAVEALVEMLPAA